MDTFLFTHYCNTISCSDRLLCILLLHFIRSEDVAIYTLLLHNMKSGHAAIYTLLIHDIKCGCAAVCLLLLQCTKCRPPPYVIATHISVASCCVNISAILCEVWMCCYLHITTLYEVWACCCLSVIATRHKVGHIAIYLLLLQYIMCGHTFFQTVLKSYQDAQ
jgi:hypothetical protein